MTSNKPRHQVTEWKESCDHCVWQEGRHYCLRHTMMLRDPDRYACEDHRPADNTEDCGLQQHPNHCASRTMKRPDLFNFERSDRMRRAEPTPTPFRQKNTGRVWFVYDQFHNMENGREVVFFRLRERKPGDVVPTFQTVRESYFLNNFKPIPPSER